MGNKLFTLAICAFGIVFLIVGRSYSETEYLYVTSASFPTFVALVLILCTVILFVKQIYDDKKSEQSTNEKRVTPYGLIVIGVLIVFYVILSWIGFLLAGALITMFFAFMLQGEKKKVFDTIIYPIIVVVVIVFFFKQLQIYLPSGAFF